MQFGVNLGWVFLVTLLPTYLNEAFGVPLDEIGPMQSTALAIGCLSETSGAAQAPRCLSRNATFVASAQNSDSRIPS